MQDNTLKMLNNKFSGLRPLTDAIPDIAIVIDTEGKVVYGNQAYFEKTPDLELSQCIGARFGSVYGCEKAKGAQGGCGTAEACQYCGLKQSVSETFQNKRGVRAECSVNVTQNGVQKALSYVVSTSLLEYDSEEYVFAVLHDSWTDQRNDFLEKRFFQFLISRLGSIQGLSEFLVDHQGIDDVAEISRDISDTASDILRQVTRYQLMLRAESGTLTAKHDSIAVKDLLSNLESHYLQRIESGVLLRFDYRGSDVIQSDIDLIRISLISMIDNAIEASAEGKPVTIRSFNRNGYCWIAVHNTGSLEPHVRSQVFRRSYTTKGDIGRGLGTYLARLYTENYLGGEVGFKSADQFGTVFYLKLPLDATQQIELRPSDKLLDAA